MSKSRKAGDKKADTGSNPEAGAQDAAATPEVSDRAAKAQGEEDADVAGESEPRVTTVESPDIETADEAPPAAASATTTAKPARPAATAPPADDASARRGGLDMPRAWPATLLIVVVAAFLIGALAAYWPRLMGGSDEQRIAALEARIEQLTAPGQGGAAVPQGGNQDAAVRRLESIETRLGTLERNAPTIFNPEVQATLDERMTAMEQRTGEMTQSIAALIARLNSVEAATPADLPQRLQGFATREEQANLEARMQRVEALRYAASVLALARLSRAAEEEREFRREYDALAAVSAGDPGVARLAPYATRGVPTTATLRERFPEAAREAIRAERTAAADGFWERQWARLRNALSIRRLTATRGDDSESRLARAQAALDGNNLAGAVAEVRALEGAAATVMGPWLRDAEARLAVARAIYEIEQRVTNLLAQAPPPLPPEPDPALASETAPPPVPGVGVLPRSPAQAAPPGAFGARPGAPAPATPASPAAPAQPPVAGPAPPVGTAP